MSILCSPSKKAPAVQRTHFVLMHGYHSFDELNKKCIQVGVGEKKYPGKVLKYVQNLSAEGLRFVRPYMSSFFFKQAGTPKMN